MVTATAASGSNGAAAAVVLPTQQVPAQPIQYQQQQQPTRRRTVPHSNTNRTFAIFGRLRFQCTRRRILDAVLDGASWCLEGFVYIIGPLLILLALSIISLLGYTFFWIIRPMMVHKHALRPIWQQSVILACHTGTVLFLITNVVFNYTMCVLQRHTGPQYDKVVRELAAITDFDYPETPEQVAACRRDFSDRMVLRLRRRQARDAEEYAAASATTATAATANAAAVVANLNSTTATGNGMATAALSSSANSTTTNEAGTMGVPDGMTKRRNPLPSAAGATLPTLSRGTTSAASLLPISRPPPPPPPPIRTWMLMGPYEWGFCSTTNQPKPPRSHYDHVTQSLVLNLDHYCPWMFNAIGYLNYRYFVNVLIFAFVGMAYGTAILLQPFLLLKSHEYRNQLALQRAATKRGFAADMVKRIVPMMPLREEKLLLTLSFMLCAAVGIAVCMLGGFHVYLACTAQTTIEFHGNWTARKRAKAMPGAPKWKNPYSLGNACANWQQVYGSGNILWAILIPSRREPEFLPVPIPGASNRRSKHAPHSSSTTGLDLGSGCGDTELRGHPAEVLSHANADEQLSNAV